MLDCACERYLLVPANNVSSTFRRWLIESAPCAKKKERDAHGLRSVQLDCIALAAAIAQAEQAGELKHAAEASERVNKPNPSHHCQGGTDCLSLKTHWYIGIML